MIKEYLPGYVRNGGEAVGYDGELLHTGDMLQAAPR